MRSTKNMVLLAAGVICGMCIGWMDSRPTWDDTGITVGAVFVVSLFLGAAVRERPWLVAIAVAAPLAMLELSLTGQGGAFASFVPACAGAYAGAFARKLL